MSLERDIEIYREQELQHLNEIKAFYEGLKLLEAITKASIGMTVGGKMDRHQWRVGYKNGTAGAQELIKKKIELQKCKSFEEIFSFTEVVKKKIWRLGDLWSYDTALRIGFNLKIYPATVYIQAGVIEGAIKARVKIKGRRSIPITEFPAEIQRLSAYEAENFLCIWGKIL